MLADLLRAYFACATKTNHPALGREARRVQLGVAPAYVQRVGAVRQLFVDQGREEDQLGPRAAHCSSPARISWTMDV